MKKTDLEVKAKVKVPDVDLVKEMQEKEMEAKVVKIPTSMCGEIVATFKEQDLHVEIKETKVVDVDVNLKKIEKSATQKILMKVNEAEVKNAQDAEEEKAEIKRAQVEVVNFKEELDQADQLMEHRKKNVNVMDKDAEAKIVDNHLKKKLVKIVIVKVSPKETQQILFSVP